MMMSIEVMNIKENKKYTCYYFLSCSDGFVYGVCYADGDNAFTLIPYTELKPVKTL